MSGDDSFVFQCERCGKECNYEDLMFICEMYVCKECYQNLVGCFVFIEEDDGYPD